MPIRKFNMLLERHDKLSSLRELLTAEVGLPHTSQLVLMVGGRPLEADDTTLDECGVVDSTTIVISKVLGQPADPPAGTVDTIGPDGEVVKGSGAGVEDKNRQFVMQLFGVFGHATTQGQNGAGRGSIVDSVRVKHGYQLLGGQVELICHSLIQAAFQADSQARQHEVGSTLPS
jgi:hypothetical protein